MRRGPSEDEPAKAFLAVEARIAGGVLEDADREELAGLVEELGGLPATDGSLRWPLPRLWTPELDQLAAAPAEEDLEAVRAGLPVVLQRLDTPRGRARLARAVLARRDAGAVDANLAAAAIIDLACASTVLVRASVLEAGRRGRWRAADGRRADRLRSLSAQQFRQAMVDATKDGTPVYAAMVQLICSHASLCA